MINLDRYLKFLEDNKLTQPQLLLLYCLYYKRYDLIERYKKMFPTPDGSFAGKDMLRDLIDRKFIEKVGDSTDAGDYKVTDKFNKIFVDPYVAAEEFWKLYPAFMIGNEGVRYPLTAMDEDVFRELYNKKIDYSVEEHQLVMLDLKFAREQNLIRMNIQKFVSSRQWLAVREERLKVINVSPDEIRKRL